MSTKKSESDIIAEAIEVHLSESNGVDFECKDCDPQGRRPTDSNLEIEHRRARVKEFEGLNYLPFHSPEQSKRLEVLKKLRVRDNKHAFNQGRRKKLPLDESKELHLSESDSSEFKHPDGSPVGPRGSAILKAEKNFQKQGIDVAYHGEERGFSHRKCQMCGSHLGGDRHTLGLLKRQPNGRVKHVDTIEACTDCVHYVANGELPLED